MPTKVLPDGSQPDALFLTADEVAACTGYSVLTIRARIRSGRLAAEKDDRDQYWVPRLEVEKLLQRVVEPLYSVGELAALLGFSVPTVQRRIEAFPRAFKIWDQWRIPEGDVIALMQAAVAPKDERAGHAVLAALEAA